MEQTGDKSAQPAYDRVNLSEISVAILDFPSVCLMRSEGLRIKVGLKGAAAYSYRCSSEAWL